MSGLSVFSVRFSVSANDRFWPDFAIGTPVRKERKSHRALAVLEVDQEAKASAHGVI